MRFQEIIIKKRDGGELSSGEINAFIDGVTAEGDGKIPPEQISALLMAIYFNGMTVRETVALTLAMARSGGAADLSGISGVKADKHSTGGVGDKTTLIVAPIAAACGVKVAKMSGRGLGHTGGTVDKLDSIPGFKTELPHREFIRTVNAVGACLVGQSAEFAPADKKLYALRDVTGTVESLPLIAASIMSKKLAAGADCILLDVKTGSGAFMKTLADSEKLARAMTDIGNGAGRKTGAVITGMNRPLGYAIGNALEVIEAVETLRGRGPEDLKEVCLTLSAKLLQMAYEFENTGCSAENSESPTEKTECPTKNAGKNLDVFRKRAETALNDGSAFKKLCEIVSAQGGNPQALLDYSLLPSAVYTREVKTSSKGYIQSMDAERWGIASAILGAGRKTKDGAIDYGAGIVLRKKTGDYVNAGDAVAVLYANDEKLFKEAEAAACEGLKTGGEKPETEPLIYSESVV